MQQARVATGATSSSRNRCNRRGATGLDCNICNRRNRLEPDRGSQDAGTRRGGMETRRDRREEEGRRHCATGGNKSQQRPAAQGLGLPPQDTEYHSCIDSCGCPLRTPNITRALTVAAAPSGHGMLAGHVRDKRTHTHTRARTRARAHTHTLRGAGGPGGAVT